MRIVHASAGAAEKAPLLISWLRGTGFTIRTGAPDAKAHDAFLTIDGEPLPAPARTLVLAAPTAAAPRGILRKPGGATWLTFGQDDAMFGHAFAAELLRGDAPAAADPATLALFALAERVAESDITVLINGPTGTGKEVLARTMHAHSGRKDGPFVAVNCAALPESMLEALLFGHQKGAFTGAAGAAQGFFRAANGGTLLLDEVAELPLALQAKLLRALQEREVVPLGATTPEAIDVRVIACANRDLSGEVAAGRFRADLYYRLAVFPLTTVALAERRQDIAQLTAAMILRHADARRPVPWPTLGALDALQAHPWPGNVRELENVVQRALLLAPGQRIEIAQILFDQAVRPLLSIVPAPMAASSTLDNVVQLSEFAHIRDTLAACGGNRIETARRLGISERTLRYRLAKARETGEPLDTRQARSA